MLKLVEKFQMKPNLFSFSAPQLYVRWDIAIDAFTYIEIDRKKPKKK